MNSSVDGSAAAATATAAGKTEKSMRAKDLGTSLAALTAVPKRAQPAAAFRVVCSGQIESVHYPGISNIYCRYAITYGSDWRVVHGAEDGLSQLAYQSNQHDEILLNFPIDVTFKSTNPFGWPRLVLSFYGLDALGRDVVRGYGSTMLPLTGGQVTRTVPLFRPCSSSLLQQFSAWLTGTPPEYFDAKFVAESEGREITRVASAGQATVCFNIVTGGMAAFGFSSS